MSLSGKQHNKNIKFVKASLDSDATYRTALFEQGFLLTNRNIEMTDQFPFYGNWRHVSINQCTQLYLHDTQKAYIHQTEEYTCFLIGHAYDPFAYEWDENKILISFAQAICGSFEQGLDFINNLTGLFVIGIIKDKEIFFCGDFESLRTTYYGRVGNHWYIASHEEIVALYENLSRDQYVERLETYRWYHLYGEGLPGDTSHYHELKKLMSNTYVQFRDNNFSVHRFFPQMAITMCDSEDSYKHVVAEIADVMKTTMELIPLKWKKPAISATGGRDSKGAIAASFHIKEKYQYFSYNSQPAEAVDCEAANKICKALGLQHTTYTIPLEKALYKEYDLVKAILCINSNRLYFNHNDIMKRIFFRRNKVVEVEVKSWSSEIGRALYYRKYGVKRLQKNCTPRYVNVMNNVYLCNPSLMYETDQHYKEYLHKTHFFEHLFNYDWSDLVKLEMRNSRWGADVISCEHMFAYDITIPYNNRRLAQLMLSVPLHNRI